MINEEGGACIGRVVKRKKAVSFKGFREQEWTEVLEEEHSQEGEEHEIVEETTWEKDGKLFLATYQDVVKKAGCRKNFRVKFTENSTDPGHENLRALWRSLGGLSGKFWPRLAAYEHEESITEEEISSDSLADACSLLARRIARHQKRKKRRIALKSQNNLTRFPQSHCVKSEKILLIFDLNKVLLFR